MDDEPNTDGRTGTSESSGRTPELSRRGVLAGTVGLGLVSKFAAGNRLGGFSIAAQDSAPIEIGSRLGLFVDDYLIDETDGVESTLHHPDIEEKVIEHDEPWEGKYSGVYSLFRDEDYPYDYRLYYRAAGPGHPTRNAYAESDDGVDWEKPNLTDDDTNIVTDFDGVGNPAVFKDQNPAAPAAEQYKAIGITDGPALSAYTSPDGFDWTPIDDNPIITQGAFDTHNTAIWDPVEEEYRSFSRAFEGGRRIIQTATSPDFRNWTEPVPLEYPEAPEEQLYTNGIKPYYRAPHIWLGFPMRYVERDPNSQSMRELPGWDLRQDLLPSRQGYAVTDALFMSSRDGQTFNRAPKSFLPPGLWKETSKANWFYGDNTPAWQLVETPSSNPEKPRELSLYAQEDYRNGESESGIGASSLRRYSLRIDGFISMEAPLSGGEFVTKPVIFEGDELVVNYATSAAGSVRIELRNPDGQPYQGFSLSESPELFGDDLERVVEWQSDADVCELEGRPVRLRFVMSDAHVYSFQFRSTGKPTEPVGEAVAHWPMDAIQSDGTVLDASGNGNHGTNNGTTVVDGVVDNALAFDNEDYVDVSNISLGDTVTVAGWVSADNSEPHDQQIFDGGDHTYVLYHRKEDERPVWYVALENGGSTDVRGPSLPSGTWAHWAGTYDGSTLRLYIDGELVASKTLSSAPVLSSGECRIGDYKAGGHYHLNGRMDDLYVFDHALSQEQIRTLVQKGSGNDSGC